MPWRDDMLDASLGGAPFFVASISGSGGRRTVITEFPDADEPGSEDMGRSARRWQVEAVVVGDEYMRARDALLEVLESAGPHKFIHPWQGDRGAVRLDGGYQLSETVGEGGAARFSFTVVEAGVAGGTDMRITQSPAAGLTVAVAAVVAAADAELVQKLAKPGIVGAVSDAIGKISDAMQSVRRRTLGALAGADDLVHALADLKEARNELAGLPSSIMSQVRGLLAALAAVVRVSADADDAPFPGGEKRVRIDVALQASAALQATFLETPPPYDGVEVDQVVLDAERVMQRAFRAAAVATYAELFLSLPLESTADVAKILDDLGDDIDALMLDRVPATRFTARSRT
ncbi:DNA circularization N-terminal domain-containing protein [Nannocystis pusilla]|uniref:DNA circularization N-terminal domain-containing protein n=1 Tax=Nannocystis pusilla TaxID=889268 RepID=A0A9X3EIT7_9BACT|nr:DNA circularization N-terminal domain-containing protein [Nannocystis pusilla]MCY1003990.1 DNA circularization N-terminal domain-containing protein [Nannocystis pusilla]